MKLIIKALAEKQVLKKQAIYKDINLNNKNHLDMLLLLLEK